MLTAFFTFFTIVASASLVFVEQSTKHKDISDNMDIGQYIRFWQKIRLYQTASKQLPRTIRNETSRTVLGSFSLLE